VLLLAAPVRLRIEAGEGEFRLTVGYLFFSRRLPDAQKVAEKTVKEAPETAPKAPKKAARKLDVSIEELLDLALGLWPPVRRLIRAVQLRHLSFHLAVGGSDAAAAALNYGRLCGVVAYGEALLRSIFRRVEIDALTVVPDFLGEGLRYQLDVTLKLRPGRVLWTGLVLIVKAFPFILKLARPPQLARTVPAT
jgi:hypothetical protein